MTLEMLVQFGFAREGIEAGDDRYTISHGHGYAPKPRGYLVEGDASAASYFFGLPLVVTGAVEIHGITKDSLQGDTEFASQVEHCGATVDWKDRSALCSFTADEARPFKGSFYAFSDTFLTAAAITPVLDGSSRIEGIEHTRHQECDRVAAMADGLKRVGQEVTEEPASLTVDPRPLLPAEIETFHDHRVAMSFGVLGCRDAMQNGEPWLTLRNPGCCAKTFPTFFDALEKVRMQSEAASRD